MSITSKFASPAKDPTPKLHAFIPNCLFMSTFRYLKKSQTQCIQNRTPGCRLKKLLHMQIFSSQLVQNHFRQQFWSYPWLFPLFHIPLLIWLKILFILHFKTFKNAVLLTISILSFLCELTSSLSWITAIASYTSFLCLL